MTGFACETGLKKIGIVRSLFIQAQHNIHRVKSNAKAETFSDDG